MLISSLFDAALPSALPSFHALCHCRFADRIKPHKDRIPAEARRVIDEEMAKLSNLESASSEFNVARNYLDWLTAIPWGHYTQERLDIQHAQKVSLTMLNSAYISAVHVLQGTTLVQCLIWLKIAPKTHHITSHHMPQRLDIQHAQKVSLALVTVIQVQ